MANISFKFRSSLSSEAINKRFSDMLGKSVLSGFFLTKGTGDFDVSITTGSDDRHLLTMKNGIRIEEFDTLLDVLQIEPNTTGSARVDTAYVKYDYTNQNSEVEYLIRKGLANGVLSPEEDEETHMAIGYIHIPSNGNMTSATFTHPYRGINLPEGSVNERALSEEFKNKLNSVPQRSELDLVNQQLADKAEKEEVRENTTIRPIDVDEMNTRTKQLFTGGAVAVVGENTVGNENIKDKAVSLNNLEFAKTSMINLANKKYSSGLGITTMGAITTSGAENSRYLFMPIQGGKTYFVRKFDSSDRLRVAVFTETTLPAIDTQGTGVFNTTGDVLRIDTKINDKSLFILVSATGQEPRINFTEEADFTEYVRPFHFPKEVILPEIENAFLKKHNSQTVVENRLTGYPSRPDVNSVVWVGVNEPSDAEVFDEWRQIEGFTYFTDFSEYQTIDELTDWRAKLGGTHEKELVKSDGDNYIEYRPTSSSPIQRFAFIWDEPSEDNGNEDVEVYAKMKTTSLLDSINTAILIRGSGETTESFSGYVIGVFGPEIRVYRYNNGASQLLSGTIPLDPLTFDVTKFFNLVARVEGSLIKVKCWQNGKEPTEWQLNITDTAPPNRGYVGVFKTSTNNYDYLTAFGVGVGGMRSPKKEDDAMIQTPYEISGEFATSAEGQQFMVDLAADTGQELISIGKSFNDNELYCLKMGQGEDVLLLLSGVHRSEPASREMLMMKTRDMAYNADGNYTDFLSKYTVYSLPTLNPDTMYRNNAQNININRDFHELNTPEASALVRLMSVIKPKMFLDIHERGGTADKVEWVNPWKLEVNTPRFMYDTSRDHEEYLSSELLKRGIPSGDYPRGSIGVSSTTNIALNLGAISLTPETFLGADPHYRINALNIVLDETLVWFDNNIDTLRDLSDTYNEAIQPHDAMYLFNGNNEYIGNATMYPIKAPEGYIIEDIEAFSKWIYAFDIQIDEDGFIPIRQRSGRILPIILDPESDLKVTTATRVEPTEPERRTDGRYTKVLYDEWREVFIKNFSER